MSINELKDKLSIKRDLSEVEGGYELTLNDSDEFQFFYSKLSNCDDLDLLDSQMDEHKAQCVYMDKDFDIALKADFDKDEYTLKFEEA